MSPSTPQLRLRNILWSMLAAALLAIGCLTYATPRAAAAGTSSARIQNECFDADGALFISNTITLDNTAPSVGESFEVVAYRNGVYAGNSSHVLSAGDKKTLGPIVNEVDDEDAGNSTQYVIYAGSDRTRLLAAASFGVEDCSKTVDPDEPSSPVVVLISGSRAVGSTAPHVFRVINTDDPTNLAQGYILTVENRDTGRIVVEDKTLGASIPDGGYRDVTINLPVGNLALYVRDTYDEQVSNIVKVTVAYKSPSFTVTNKAKGHVRVCAYYPSFRLMWEDGNSKGTSFGENHWTGNKTPGCSTLNTYNVKPGTTNWVRVTISKPGPNVIKKIRIRR